MLGWMISCAINYTNYCWCSWEKYGSKKCVNNSQPLIRHELGKPHNKNIHPSSRKQFEPTKDAQNKGWLRLDLSILANEMLVIFSILPWMVHAMSLLKIMSKHRYSKCSNNMWSIKKFSWSRLDSKDDGRLLLISDIISLSSKRNKKESMAFISCSFGDEIVYNCFIKIQQQHKNTKAVFH